MSYPRERLLQLKELIWVVCPAILWWGRTLVPLRLSDLIEQHYKEHWSLPRYTTELGISETRLHQICQNIADQPPKRLIQDRTIQEAKLLLTMTEQPIR